MCLLFLKFGVVDTWEIVKQKMPYIKWNSFSTRISSQWSTHCGRTIIRTSTRWQQIQWNLKICMELHKIQYSDFPSLLRTYWGKHSPSQKERSEIDQQVPPSWLYSSTTPSGKENTEEYKLGGIRLCYIQWYNLWRSGSGCHNMFCEGLEDKRMSA